jgi:redox-sensitive bicupin YhaK (pirin superfamily)
MLWSEDIPLHKITDKNGKHIQIKVIAGVVDTVNALPPAPDSWASEPENEVGVWTVTMDAGSQWIVPAAGEQVNRTIYFHSGTTIIINDTPIISNQAIEVKADQVLTIANGNSETSLLILQGKPINEPMVQYGPFVMNTQPEIRQAFADYQQTEFGGWPWPRRDQVHPREQGRFARYRDGSEENRF